MDNSSPLLLLASSARRSMTPGHLTIFCCLYHWSFGPTRPLLLLFLFHGSKGKLMRIRRLIFHGYHFMVTTLDHSSLFLLVLLLPSSCLYFFSLLACTSSPFLLLVLLPSLGHSQGYTIQQKSILVFSQS